MGINICDQTKDMLLIRSIWELYEWKSTMQIVHPNSLKTVTAEKSVWVQKPQAPISIPIIH